MTQMKGSKDMDKIGKMGRKLGQESGKLYKSALDGKTVKGSVADEIAIGRKMGQEFKKNGQNILNFSKTLKI